MRRVHPALWGAALAALAFAAALVAHARAANGALGFPIDDSWIHLTFARTLREHGAFAYFPGGPSTSGSTSPLYTLLLAAGFFVTGNEKLLAIGLGLAAQAIFLAALCFWARERLGSAGWAAAAVLLAGCDGRLAILSVSGMETSLFLACVALAFLAAARASPIACASACGLALWVRPEGAILAGVLAIDAALRAVVRPRDHRFAPGRWLGPIAVFVAIAAVYAAFNLGVGGHPLPGTFAAKTAYYAGSPRAAFLADEAAGLFRTGGWIVLAPCVAFGILREGVALARRRDGRLRAEAGWVIALPLAFLVLLPYAHRFGRYLVPILPAAAILGLAAARDALAWARARRPAAFAALTAAAALALAVPHGVAAARAFGEYRSFCAYHAARHEACGRWLATHTPEDAVVATHDIGAIGFYSRRRIVDIAGLIDPEVVPHLHRPDYTEFLVGELTRRGVTHLAVLRNWLEVTGVEPLFLADPAPEILEVYPWIPGRTHLVPEAATALEQLAARRLASGDAAGALTAIERSLAIDPKNARGQLLEGKVHASAGRLADAEAAYRRALALLPEAPDARFALATVLAATGRRDEALAIVTALRREGRSVPRLEELYRALGGV